MHAISSYHGNRPTHPPTNTLSHRDTQLCILIQIWQMKYVPDTVCRSDDPPFIYERPTTVKCTVDSELDLPRPSTTYCPLTADDVRTKNEDVRWTMTTHCSNNTTNYTATGLQRLTQECNIWSVTLMLPRRDLSMWAWFNTERQQITCSEYSFSCSCLNLCIICK